MTDRDELFEALRPVRVSRSVREMLVRSSDRGIDEWPLERVGFIPLGIAGNLSRSIRTNRSKRMLFIRFIAVLSRPFDRNAYGANDYPPLRVGLANVDDSEAWDRPFTRKVAERTLGAGPRVDRSQLDVVQSLESLASVPGGRASVTDEPSFETQQPVLKRDDGPSEIPDGTVIGTNIDPRHDHRFSRDRPDVPEQVGPFRESSVPGKQSQGRRTHRQNRVTGQGSGLMGPSPGILSDRMIARSISIYKSTPESRSDGVSSFTLRHRRRSSDHSTEPTRVSDRHPLETMPDDDIDGKQTAKTPETWEEDHEIDETSTNNLVTRIIKWTEALISPKQSEEDREPVEPDRKTEFQSRPVPGIEGDRWDSSDMVTSESTSVEARDLPKLVIRRVGRIIRSEPGAPLAAGRGEPGTSVVDKAVRERGSDPRGVVTSGPEKSQRGSSPSRIFRRPGVDQEPIEDDDRSAERPPTDESDTRIVSPSDGRTRPERTERPVSRLAILVSDRIGSATSLPQSIPIPETAVLKPPLSYLRLRESNLMEPDGVAPEPPEHRDDQPEIHAKPGVPSEELFPDRDGPSDPEWPSATRLPPLVHRQAADRFWEAVGFYGPDSPQRPIDAGVEPTKGHRSATTAVESGSPRAPRQYDPPRFPDPLTELVMRRSTWQRLKSPYDGANVVEAMWPGDRRPGPESLPRLVHPRSPSPSSHRESGGRAAQREYRSRETDQHGPPEHARVSVEHTPHERSAFQETRIERARRRRYDDVDSRPNQSHLTRWDIPPEGRPTIDLYPEMTVNTLAPRIDVTYRDAPAGSTQPDTQQGDPQDVIDEVEALVSRHAAGGVSASTDLHRTVERIYRALDRKQRMERERRGR